MADLTFTDVLVAGGVATVGFTLLSYWFSGVMARRNWSWQVRPKPAKGGGQAPGGARPLPPVPSSAAAPKTAPGSGAGASPRKP